MITALHVLLYAEDAQTARDFFREVVGWRHVDAGDGWLIFRSGPSELAVHPAGGGQGESAWTVPVHHEVTLVCDDVVATVADLTRRGATFTRGIQDESFGLTTMMAVPGAGEVMVYQPHHTSAFDA